MSSATYDADESPQSPPQSPGRHPNGHYQRTHGVRALQHAAGIGRLDAEAQAAVDGLIAHYAEDAGGLAEMTNRELGILRDIAVADLIIAEAFKWAHNRGDIIDEGGNLLPVFSKSLLAFINSKRLGLVALGLKPGRDTTAATTCSRCSGTFAAAEYISHRCPPPASIPLDASTAAVASTGSGGPASDDDSEDT